MSTPPFLMPIIGRDVNPPTRFQPTLPPEQPFTEAEIAFMEESPPGLFPENQDSNFGYLIRRIFSNHMQTVVDQLTTIYAEHFVETSQLFLDDWEIDLGVPVSPNLTVAQRRSILIARINAGMFTRATRDTTIESFLLATFGTVVQFSPDGIPLTPSGVPLYAEAGDISTMYRVVEDLTNFTYQIRIINTMTPDEASMRRALDRITPAGISYTIVYVPVP